MKRRDPLLVLVLRLLLVPRPVLLVVMVLPLLQMVVVMVILGEVNIWCTNKQALKNEGAIPFIFATLTPRGPLQRRSRLVYSLYAIRTGIYTRTGPVGIWGTKGKQLRQTTESRLVLVLLLVLLLVPLVLSLVVEVVILLLLVVLVVVGQFLVAVVILGAQASKRSKRGDSGDLYPVFSQCDASSVTMKPYLTRCSSAEIIREPDLSVEASGLMSHITKVTGKPVYL